MNLFKTAAAALAIVAATAGAASAAQFAWADQDANVRLNHKNIAPVVNWIEEGQKVQVIGNWNNWYKIKIPGQDGWVKAGVLDFSPFPGPFPGPHTGGSFCVEGKGASFCINASY
jgi:uncharacterized protein YraI